MTQEFLAALKGAKAITSHMKEASAQMKAVSETIEETVNTLQ